LGTNDTNDLDIIINALSTNDGGNSTLSIGRNVTVGAGTITLTGDVNDTPTILFAGTGAQIADSAIVVTTDGFGVLSVTNTGGTVTIADIIGVNGNGLESISIASGANLTQNVGAAAGTFNVVGNVDDGAGGVGGTLVIEGGDSRGGGIAGGAVTAVAIEGTGTNQLTGLTIQGGDAGTTGVGGAVTATAITGAVTATTYNIVGGKGGAGGGAATSGVGGAVATHLQTGNVISAVNITGGAGGAGGASDVSDVGGAGGVGGAVAVSAVGGVSGTVTATSAGGTAGGAGAQAAGATGSAGGAIVITDIDGAIGTGLTLSAADGSWDVSADYDADIKSDFLAHTGRVQAKFNF